MSTPSPILSSYLLEQFKTHQNRKKGYASRYIKASRKSQFGISYFLISYSFLGWLML
jgi:hypothetical protein